MTGPATAPAYRWPMRIGCHGGLFAQTFNGPAFWEPREQTARMHCTACGSIHPGSLYRLLADVRPTPPPWDRSSGADAAYRTWQGIYLASLVDGWPRRLHILDQGAQLVLDARHLQDLNEPEFAAVAGVIARHAGVQFGRLADGRLTYTGVTT